MNEVKFISYDGSYPNLCRGSLVFSVDGVVYDWTYSMSSGGCVWFDDDYDAHIENGHWTIDPPKGFENVPWLKELERLVNANVERGCCGGCI